MKNRYYYQKAFTRGAYYVTFLLLTIFLIIDIYQQNFTDVVVTTFISIFIIFLYFYLVKKDKIKKATIALFWLVTFAQFIYFLKHAISYKIFFSITTPLILFFSNSKKEITKHLLSYYFLIVGLLFYKFIMGDEIFKNKDFLLSFVISHIFVIIFTYFYYKSIDAFINSLEESNKKQQFLIKEIHHRVKNNLNLISSILGLQIDFNNKKEMEFLKKNQKRIDAMASLHEILYQQDIESKKSLKTYLIKLLELEKKSSSKEIIYLLNISDCNLDLDILIQIGIVLNEFIANSIKYNKNSKIYLDISFYQQSQTYILKYCEKNATINKEFSPKFGLNLVKMALCNLNATMQYNLKPYLCYTIIIKV